MPKEEVTLVFGEGSLVCDKEMLMASSQYFNAMFSHDFSDKNALVIPIEDENISLASVRLIRDTYVGKSRIKAINWKTCNCDPLDLLYTASVLQFDILSYIMKHVMDTLLRDPEYCLQIMLLADHLQFKGLYQRAVLYCHWSFSKIFKTISFQSLSFDQLMDYLSSKKLNVPYESCLFKAICFWIDHEPITRSSQISELLKLIRYVDVSVTEIEVMLAHKYVEYNAEAKQLLNNMKKIKLGHHANGNVETMKQLLGIERDVPTTCYILFGAVYPKQIYVLDGENYLQHSERYNLKCFAHISYAFPVDDEIWIVGKLKAHGRNLRYMAHCIFRIPMFSNEVKPITKLPNIGHIDRAVYLNNKIYFLEKGTMSNRIYIYDIVANTWQTTYPDIDIRIRNPNPTQPMRRFNRQETDVNQMTTSDCAMSSDSDTNSQPAYSSETYREVVHRTPVEGRTSFIFKDCFYICKGTNLFVLEPSSDAWSTVEWLDGVEKVEMKFFLPFKNDVYAISTSDSLYKMTIANLEISSCEYLLTFPEVPESSDLDRFHNLQPKYSRTGCAIIKRNIIYFWRRASAFDCPLLQMYNIETQDLASKNEKADFVNANFDACFILPDSDAYLNTE